jgi:hypothetical protein
MNRLLVILVIMFISFSAGCVENEDEGAAQVIDRTVIADPHIEVIFFYGNMECYSCRTVGFYAEDTVNTYFADELESGDLVFMHVNYDLPENKELLQRYGASYSSLWIGTYTEEGFTAEQNLDVWYLMNDKEGYMAYFSEVIDKKLEDL